jgi:ribosomal RNA-processing protein 7
LCCNRTKRKRDDIGKADINTMGDKPKNRKRKKKNTELKNFYRFQIRDDKMKQLDVLRKKFEEDKERVTKMKEARKFNPF